MSRHAEVAHTQGREKAAPQQAQQRQHAAGSKFAFNPKAQEPLGSASGLSWLDKLFKKQMFSSH